MDKSTHEEHLSQPLQTNIKKIKIAVIFLTGYNGIFIVTNSINKFYFKKSITDEKCFIQISIPSGAYGIESLNNEIKRIIIHEDHFTEANYPCTIKPNLSTLGSLMEISPQGPIFSFMFNGSKRDLLRFHANRLYEKYNLSDFSLDILSFDNIFLECDIAQRMIFKGKRSGVSHKFTMDVDPGYEFFEKFRGRVQWYMMESKDIISSIFFKLKNENNHSVSFNSQSNTLRLPIKKFNSYKSPKH